jgi:hypothetical protein
MWPQGGGKLVPPEALMVPGERVMRRSHLQLYPGGVESLYGYQAHALCATSHSAHSGSPASACRPRCLSLPFTETGHRPRGSVLQCHRRM